ncbi:30S ribosomal protein S17e [Candidatus Woesearchaeota archaeon]|nr:30S ribosomal protein S17e [Candidatus Woesearchaeota archaeon]
MGRIKTQKIKRATEELIEKHGDKFKKNFKENKEILNELVDVPSKKMRNILAGYITRIVKTRKEI